MSKKVVNVLAKVFQALQEGKKSYREIAEENGVSKGDSIQHQEAPGVEPYWRGGDGQTGAV